MARARKPIASDSPRAMTPRTIGIRSHLCLRRTDATGRLTSTMSPSAFRTATDHADGPRIITPSRTAWPPIGADIALSAAGSFEAALEPLDAPAGVEELLLTRVEGVAFRADLDVELAPRRARLELVAARAAHGGEHVFGVNVSLHSQEESSVGRFPLRISEAVWVETLPPETTTATVFPLTWSILPARRAPTPTAAPGSAASFARS